MPEINVTWEWESISPLHVGSGLSRPGVADNLVQRDPEGNAVIHGEAVKGALRMGAEQIVAWMGVSQDHHYDSQGTAEPRLWPLARLFGGDAVARCTPATVVTEKKDRRPGARSEARSHIVASTAIDRSTGTARDNTLRKTEIVPKGLRFRSGYMASAAEDEVEVIETLLLAALTSVDSVGGKAGIGWGRMTLCRVGVKVDGKKRCSPDDALSPCRLKQLRGALEEDSEKAVRTERTTAGVNAGSSTAEAAGSSSQSEEDRWFKLTITLEEPTCLPGPPEISNKVTTHDWIAATTLRGALAGHWRRSGRKDDDILSWLSESTCWTPGFRVIDGALVLSAPRSFVTTKRTLGATRPLHDSLSGAPPEAHDGTDLQWRPLGGESIHWSDGQAKVADDGGLRETRMHVARSYRTGSKRAGALYARESLVPGTVFVSWARVPASAFEPGKKFELLLGKRVSTGNGRATVQVEQVAGPNAALEVEPEGSTDVFVHLLSPAVVYDPQGYPYRTLDFEWWNNRFGVQLRNPDKGEDTCGRTAPGRRGGWMTSWRHPRASVTTIEAGSVWRLRCESAADAEDLRKNLRAQARIGERTHEGFGWIAVDPPWVGGISNGRLPEAATPAPKAAGEPSPWPGIVGTDASTLANIARELAEVNVKEEAASAFREVAARVRVAPKKSNKDARAHLDGLKALCADRAEKKPSRWESVKQVIPDALWNEPEQLLFALDMLATRAARTGE